MTDKELRRLSRAELLEMLLMLKEENENLKMQLEQAEVRLHDRRIMIEKAGSIAEAALQLNDVFAAADRAVQQYLENVRCMAEEDSTS
ncbi:MAG: DNA repair protein [Lachnospiraceae bacterium]|nr:DNA repair protein [Lachnospiraceae bacterium]